MLEILLASSVPLYLLWQIFLVLRARNPRPDMPSAAPLGPDDLRELSRAISELRGIIQPAPSEPPVRALNVAAPRARANPRNSRKKRVSSA